MDFPSSWLTSAAVALGGGMLIGIERERRKGTGPGRAIAGIRTFALAAIGGTFAQAAGFPWLTIIGAALIAALITIAHYRDRSDDPGITTELALFFTYVLGVLAARDAQLASAGFVLITALLASKTHLHRFATHTLTEIELREGLILAAAALIVYPLVPNRSIALLGNINPQHLWRLVVLLMALQAVGYIALRLMGPRLGLAVAGLASGIVSSSSTFAAMGARAKAEPSLTPAYAASALCSNWSSMVLLAAVGVAIGPAALGASWPIIATMVVVSAVPAAHTAFSQPSIEPGKLPSGHVFSLRQALVFSLVLTGLTMIVGMATDRYGAVAAEAGAALAATVDMQAAGAALFSLYAGDAIDATALKYALTIAISTNAASKIAIAFAAGGTAFGMRAAAGLLPAAAAAWIVVLVAASDP